MNIINEQRENIIQNSNTAQQSLAYLLENINKQTTTIFIKEMLHGDLDLSVIKEMGFGRLESIIFREGEITSIINIPEGIIHFECINNLLINIDKFPASLQSINLDNNYINTIDISYLKKLYLFNISHNKLSNIERLPQSLTTLNCENNDLQRIDLDGSSSLVNLNISNNKITIVENLPDNMVAFLYDNNPTFEYRNKGESIDLPTNTNIMDDKTKINYINALHDYFKLKNKYMKEYKEIKHKIFKKSENKRVARNNIARVKMACIKCKRKVGTIFETKDNRHIAICGDTKSPCTLNIQIFNGADTVSIIEILDDLKWGNDENKRTIIQHKFDTLFNYISEEESIKLYKTELENINSVSSIYKEYLDMYNDLYNNVNKKSTIDKKNREIFTIIEKNREILKEYSNSANASEKMELIKNVVHTQIQELLPETRSVSLLKYDINTIVREEQMSDVFHYKLFQMMVDPQKNYVYSGEPPRVIHFVK